MSCGGPNHFSCTLISAAPPFFAPGAGDLRARGAGDLAQMNTQRVSLLRRIFRELKRMRERQWQRRAFLQLDDHMLADVGVSRDQAVSEARKPFWK